MEAFFARYTFEHDPSAEYYAEFNRLVAHHKWAEKSHARRKALKRFRTALILEFNNRFGTDHTDLDAWQNLCKFLGIEPVPESITQCRKSIKKTHVNLVDMLDARDGEEVQHFKNLRGLQEYTSTTGKVFPKDKAKAGGLLKHLLREMQL